jgi:hypothetical protein
MANSQISLNQDELMQVLCQQRQDMIRDFIGTAIATTRGSVRFRSSALKVPSNGEVDKSSWSTGII